LAILVTLTVVAGAFCYPSSKRQIQRQLEDLAHTCSFEHLPLGREKESAITQALSNAVADPVTLNLAELGESALTPEELAQGFLAYSADFERLSVELNHVQIELSNNDARAVATMEVVVRTESHARKSIMEPRQAICTLEMRGNRWLVIHAKITAPRIDQPEARP
jgi:hypothetical protein